MALGQLSRRLRRGVAPRLAVVAALWAAVAAGSASQAAEPGHQLLLPGPAGTQLLQGSAAQRPGLSVFRGLRYATAQRWAPPVVAAAVPGLLDATRGAAVCPQPVAKFDPFEAQAVAPAAMAEDCLFLNVWAPQDRSAAPRPVLVWIHGGAFTFGSGSLPAYDGSALASQGLVVVTINYRIGQLGYLAHPALRSGEPPGLSGNLALLDQMAALRWVQQHIAAFGGDARQVTIAGHSGGGISVGTLMASPQARGLFARAIIQSGPPSGLAPPMPDLAAAEALGQRFAANRQADSAQALRALPLAEVLRRLPGDQLTGPVAGGAALPQTPAQVFVDGQQAPVPLMIGVASAESATFAGGPATPEGFERFVRGFMPGQATAVLAAYPHATPAQAQAAQARVKTDQMLAASAAYAAQHTRHGHRAWLYVFDHAPPGPDSAWQQAFHGSELLYTFGNLPVLGRPWTDADRALSQQLVQRWAQFVKTGSPALAGQPAWPAYRRGAAPFRLAAPTDPVTVLDPSRAALFHPGLDPRLPSLQPSTP